MWQQDRVMGFLLCSQDIREKNNRTQQGECHSLCVCVCMCVCLCVSASQGEKKNCLICLQRELWLCGLNQSGLDKS